MMSIKFSLLTLSIAVSTSACMQTTPEISPIKETENKSKVIKFKEVSVPRSDEEKRRITATNEIEVDGVKKEISFHTLAKSGERIGDGIYGALFDKKGNMIVEKGGKPVISHKTDFSSLLPVNDKLFMVSHFETQPAAMYLTEIAQTKEGMLNAVNTRSIDFSSVNGLWTPCAGVVTPWNTHLGSEEYEPDAARINVRGAFTRDYSLKLEKDKPYKKYKNMARYVNGKMYQLNPYDYGWTPEIIVLNEKGDTKVIKHYAMGRFSHELAYVMPDQKTVYLSDDGNNVGLFMFIADNAGDLSSGSLYAAKWLQRSKRNAGRGDIQWINLGHSTNFEVRMALKKKIKFNDIFERSTKPEAPKAGFVSVNTTNGQEYLKIKPGMEKIASRLETRRYAALKGATTEFSKMEGIAHNANDNILYLAMSSIYKGMEDNQVKGESNDKYDQGGNNDIQLAYNPCGAVYGLNMLSYSKPHATDGSLMNSSYVANSMYTILSGEKSHTIKGNNCSVWNIANPDNLSFIPNTRTLIIGEDTKDGHQNDYVWSYNLADKELTRIMTTPYGAETTSPYFYNNIGGHGYLMSVIQHPYGEEDGLNSKSEMKQLTKTKHDIQAVTGFIGPLPRINP